MLTERRQNSEAVTLEGDVRHRLDLTKISEPAVGATHRHRVRRPMCGFMDRESSVTAGAEQPSKPLLSMHIALSEPSVAIASVL